MEIYGRITITNEMMKKLSNALLHALSNNDKAFTFHIKDFDIVEVEWPSENKYYGLEESEN